jgi:hypothetical protein
MKTEATEHGPHHYKMHEIEPIEFILSNNLTFCEGNVVKYVSRWRNKGGIEDLRKARHYIDFMIDQEMKDAAALDDEDSIYSNFDDEQPPF